MELRHVYASVNGIKLHCAVAGSGPLLVLLHGFPEFWFGWRFQIPTLSQHFTVAAPDLRGYNLSDKPGRISDYTLPTLAQDIADLIGCFGEERAVVVGHDWGGGVAWQLTMSRPELVDALIVLNSPHLRLFTQHLLTNPRQMLRSWYIGFVQLPWLPELLIRAMNFRFLELALRGGAAHPEHWSNDDLARYKTALAQPGALTAALNYYRAAARAGVGSLNAVDPVVRCPVLALWGEGDPALGRELNNNLARYVPNLTLRYLADASHWVQHDQPAAVNAAILDFLRAR